MKIKNLIFFALSFLGISGTIFSQEYNYTHYTVEDGLPSSEVYSTFQDSKGYIWFATDAGVSRFNGYEFKNFDVKDGLTDNTVFLIREDSKGRIWFGTFNRKLCYFYNNKIYPYRYNKKLKSFLKETNVLSNFFIDDSETIWLSFLSGGGVVSCDKNGKIVQHILPRNDYSFTIKINDTKNNIWGGISSFKSYYNILQRKSHLIDIFVQFQNDSLVKLTGWKYNVSNLIAMNLSVISDNRQTNIILDDSVYFFDSNNKFFKKLKFNGLGQSRLYSSLLDDNAIWLCTENNGVIMYDNSTNDFKKNQVILLNKKISRIFKDSEGGRWFLSLKEGAFYLKSSIFHLINFNGCESIKCMEVDTLTNQIFIQNNNGQLVMLNNFQNGYDLKLINKNDYVPESLKYDYSDSSLIFAFSSTKWARYKNEKILFYNINNDDFKSLIIDSDTIYTANGYGISIIIDGKEVYKSVKELKKRLWCTSLIKNKNNIWVGTNEGLIVFSGRSIITPFEHNKYLKSSITSIERYNDEIILIGTKNYGVLVIKNEKIIEVINEKRGLVGDLIKTIHIDNQKEIWIGSNHGLSRIKDFSMKKYEIQNITTKNGLISNEILHIRSYKNHIYIATPMGLVEFDKTKLKINKTPSPIYITNFKVNDVSQDFKANQKLELKYNQNRIEIHYVSLNYKSLGKIDYRYRLLDLDTSWQNTTQTNVSFYGLPPGSYTFEVVAKNEDGFWSKPVSNSFKINPPFWLTWWFISLEVIFVLLSILVIFKYRETQLLIKSKRIQTIAENEKKIIELELKALKSQMNPHFIFNTLNSIQHFISSNNFKDSNRYITNFSKLIRMVLNHSDKSYITLREETEMLNLYLSLEQVRFSDEFEFVINIDESIDLDFDKIPPMLLQPFVENAIWHGLMNKKAKGFIEIGFTLEGDYLLCSVTDNGIGREAAAAIKATRNIQNKSVGMTITKERLNIINSEIYENMNVEMIDLFDSNNQASGTKISIKIALT